MRSVQVRARRAALSMVGGRLISAPTSRSIHAAARRNSQTLSSAAAAQKAMLPPTLAALHSRVLDDKHLKELLTPDLFKRIDESRTHGITLEKEDRSVLARAIREWAQSHGCDSFCHWFSPMRGAVHGEKTESFLSYNPETKETIANLTGSELFQTETDGSSFPNGGLRTTHNAAAYMGWDMSSPMFVYRNVLHIPSVFVAWTGEALDYKTPLLRANAALSREGVRLLRHLGDKESKGIVSFVGWEQEFFLVDREHYQARPDLTNCGRALFGNKPLNGQEQSDNYFAKMPLRVRDMLTSVREELWKMGCAIKVVHNEVAPGQHEITPIFSLAQHACDTNILAMEVLRDHCKQYGLAILFHEKPFDGINGSGKHNNFSLNTIGTGYNLAEPGESADAQRRFVAFMAVMMRAVHVHGDLLRMGVSSAGNDHRLGAQEAPPPVITLCLGERLEKFLRDVAKGGPLDGYGGEDRPAIATRTNSVQPIRATLEDRNRTAPFPWVGNRFELRAVGSDQHPAWPNALTNVAIAEALNHINDMIDSGIDVDTAIRKTIKKHQGILFHGNSYDNRLVGQIAEDNNVAQLRSSSEAFQAFGSEKNRRVFAKLGIFSEREVEARQEVARSTFAELVITEAKTTLEMLRTAIIPAVQRDIENDSRSRISQNVALKTKTDLLERLHERTESLQAAVDSTPESSAKAVEHCETRLRPKMAAAREIVDTLETRVAQDLWPYPSIAELIYTHH